MPTVVSVFGVKPFRIGGTETFARELSLQLDKHGWKSVLCFLQEPPEEVRRFLSLPNVSLEVLENSTDLNWGAAKGLSRSSTVTNQKYCTFTSRVFSESIRGWPVFCQLRNIFYRP
jgi:hypothetical protein